MRNVLKALAATTLGVAPAQSHATTIDLYVGTGAGGTYDLTARLIAKHLPKYLLGNPTIVVQNKPGRNGMILANWLYSHAPRDGSVLGLVQKGLPFQQIMGDYGVAYDAGQFNWIGSPVRLGEALVVWHESGVRSIEDAKKIAINVGVTADLGAHYTLPKLLNELVGTKFNFVRGYPNGQMINLAMQRREVDARAADPWSAWVQSRPEWVQKGWVYPIVQLGLTPQTRIRMVPLAQNLAKPEDRPLFEALAAVAEISRPLVAPPGVPVTTLRNLRMAFDTMAMDHEFIKEAKKIEFDVNPITGIDLDAMVRRMLSMPRADVERLRSTLR